MKGIIGFVLACSIALPDSVGQTLHTIGAPGSGYSKGVGDVDGDGSGDFVVSFLGGTIRLYSGATAQVLKQFSVPAVATYSQVDAGDFNGDGIQDLVAGCPTTPANNVGGFVIFDLVTGAQILSVTGTVPQTYLGRSISIAGDLDGDGDLDVIAGSLDTAQVHSGMDGALLRYYAPSYATAGEFGAAVRGGGDVNNDGTPDVVVGDPVWNHSSNPSSTGCITVYSGKFNVDVSSSQKLILFNGNSGGDQFGADVAITPDLNGDGFDDVMVHARSEVLNGAVGTLRVILGQFGNQQLWKVNMFSHPAGRCFAPVPDKDGDGKQDYLASWVNSVQLLSGGTGSVISVYSLPTSGAGVSDAGDINFDLRSEAVAVTGAAAYVYTHECGQIYSYGSGCPGSGDLTPTLSATGCPVGLGTVSVSFANSIGPTMVAIVVGTSQASVPLGGSCSLLVGNVLPEPILFIIPGDGRAGSGQFEITTKMPVFAAGLLVTLQVFADDGGVSTGFSASPGLALQFN